MKLQSIYDLAVELGMKSDIRGSKALNKLLEKAKKDFKALPEAKKELYDKEQFTNPYGDTRILTGSHATEVKSLMVGIDIDTSELLLARYLKDHGTKIDAVMAHHPDGLALANLSKVMDLQEDIMASYGVPINVINKFLDKRVAELVRGLHPINTQKSVDAANYLDIPYLTTHTTSDNLVNKFFLDLIEKHQKDLATLEDIMKLFDDIPEFRAGTKNGAGPMITVGSPRSKAGKVAVTDMTGGTSGAKEQYERLSMAGVGTVLGMHMREEYRQEAEKHQLNVIITGHMSSDSIGMNLLVDQIEAQGVKILPTAGFIRVRRPASTRKTKH